MQMRRVAFVGENKDIPKLCNFPNIFFHKVSSNIPNLAMELSWL